MRQVNAKDFIGVSSCRYPVQSCTGLSTTLASAVLPEPLGGNATLTRSVRFSPPNKRRALVKPPANPKRPVVRSSSRLKPSG